MHLYQCKLFKSAGQDKGLLKELANDKFRLCKIYVSVKTDLRFVILHGMNSVPSYNKVF